ncbi:hypothetical protein IT397_02980 [Candidatus Nomurabacteria bacterium]|nr:hypothetical protein [Candidatus Nomurabacteria bacterium]
MEYIQSRINKGDLMILMYFLRIMFLFLSYPIRWTYKANICGHRTKRTGRYVSFKEACVVTMPLAKNGKPDYCIQCIAKMAIRCVNCGKSICIGDPIQLFLDPKFSSIGDGGRKLPEYAVRYDKDPHSVIGCLRATCTDTGTGRSGFWIPPGKVNRMPSPMEMSLVCGDYEGVIVQDLTNPRDRGAVVNTLDAPELSY